LTSRSTGHDSNRVVHSSNATRDRDRNLALNRSRDSVHHSSPSSRHLTSSSSHHHDRSHYVTRHEHHSSDWYRDNGWGYDRDYWNRYHHHRYFNDSLGIFVIDNTVPLYDYGYDYYDSGYGPGYSEPLYRSNSYYGADYETRLAVQDALAQAGYYNGPIDGIVGAGTRSAISNYQYDNGLPETGLIDTPLLQSLGL
jgi:hypothetical protein